MKNYFSWGTAFNWRSILYASLRLLLATTRASIYNDQLYEQLSLRWAFRRFTAHGYLFSANRFCRSIYDTHTIIADDRPRAIPECWWRTAQPWQPTTALIQACSSRSTGCYSSRTDVSSNFSTLRSNNASVHLERHYRYVEFRHFMVDASLESLYRTDDTGYSELKFSRSDIDK